MATLTIPRVDKNSINANTGAIYHITVPIDAGTYSDVYLFPVQEMYAISALINGDGTIEFTNDTENEIDTGTPDWVEWDGSSFINPGVTAFRLKRTSGTVYTKMTIKTADM